jgi:hypothetical protein
MKLEHTTTTEGDFFEITDARGQTISLSPEEALRVADWLNHRRSEIYTILHPESAPSFTQQTRPGASTPFRASWIDDLEV